MKTSTKVLLIINVIALVGAGVFFTALLSIVNISGGVAFTFNRQSIIALTFFLLWVITGFVLFIRFVKKLCVQTKVNAENIKPAPNVPCCTMRVAVI